MAKIRAFLIGLGSVLNISGHPYEWIEIETTPEEAFRGDRERIAGDLWIAIMRYRNHQAEGQHTPPTAESEDAAQQMRFEFVE